MAIRRIDSEKEIQVSVEGSAQIVEAESLAEELLKVLESGAPSVSLSLSGIAQVDVSFFQLVLALGASLAAKGRKLSIEELPAEHIVTETSGLLGIDLRRFIMKNETLR